MMIKGCYSLILVLAGFSLFIAASSVDPASAVTMGAQESFQAADQRGPDGAVFELFSSIHRGETEFSAAKQTVPLRLAQSFGPPPSVTEPDQPGGGDFFLYPPYQQPAPAPQVYTPTKANFRCYDKCRGEPIAGSVHACRLLCGL
ncbi:MAG TPA: hypothetical protein VMC85_19965 [Desulfomonilaceae bacterium]|nr:hypothetical protein [Desulfomonilaceae bacterium]